MGTFIDTSGILAGAPATAASVKALLDGLDTALANVASGALAITPDINGGSIDGAVIGATTPAAGSFTTIGGTGDLTLTKTSDNIHVFLDNVSGGGRAVVGRTGGSLRWVLYLGNPIAETGANAGSNFSILRLSDAGGFLGTAMEITRSTGNVAFDTNVLYVDAANNRVGVNTSSPAVPFHVSGTGNLVRFGDGSGNVEVHFNGAAGTSREYFIDTNGTARWSWNFANNDAESGSNAGSNLHSVAFNDAGGFLGFLFKAWRATQNWRFYNNVMLGTDDVGTNATNTLVLTDGTPPASSPASVVQLFADTVTGTVELRVRDSAGNVSTQSPHNPQMVDATGRPTDFVHKEHNPYTGRDIEIDLYRAVELVQQDHAETLIHVRDLPPGRRENPFLKKLVNRRAQLRSRMYG
jgi:hypothetical protein